MHWPSLVTLCDFLATFAFALVGSRIAAGRKMDIGGIALVAAVYSLAGGTLRKLFLLTLPPWVLNPWLLLPVLIAVLFTITFKSTEPAGRFILLLDSFGLAVSTVSSAEFALRLHMKPAIVVLMALIGGVTGGLLRDVLAQIPPVLLHRETIGTSCLMGAIALVVANEFHPNKLIPVFIGGIFVFAIRELSIYFEWNLPRISPK